MLYPTLIVVAAALALSSTPHPTAAPAIAQGKTTPPPGLIHVRGGRAKVGLPAKEAEKLGEEEPDKFSVYARSTPQHEVRLDDYFLMSTEVTNEQYHAFVKASGHQPPQSWGKLAIEEAQRQFGLDFGKRKQEAKEKGEPLPTDKFDPARWWNKNWETSDWSLPKDEEQMPVIHVDFQDASAYARWAGMRLPTEFEYQYAGRGRTKNHYPWGEKWLEDACAYQGQRQSRASRVASFPAGATESGFYDLVGNVWEWTASPFSAYPKFKLLKIEVKDGKKKRQIDGLVGWDANMRVCVGGSWQNPSAACQLWIRNDVERTQRTNSLGFRCAASSTPGVDMARTVLRDDLPTSKRPDGYVYDPNRAVAADRWKFQPGKLATRKDGKDEPVSDYAIVTGYDYLLFVPVEQVDAVAVKDLDELSIEKAPVHFGILSTTKPMIIPELEAGTYMVAYRGAGEPRRRPKPSAEKEEEDGTNSSLQDEEEDVFVDEGPELPEGMDIEENNFVFYDIDMNPVTFLKLGAKLEAKRPEAPSVSITEGTRDVTSVNEEGETVVVQVPVDVARFRLTTMAKVSNKGYVFTLPIKFEKDVLGDGWRE